MQDVLFIERQIYKELGMFNKKFRKMYSNVSKVQRKPTKSTFNAFCFYIVQTDYFVKC